MFATRWRRFRRARRARALSLGVGLAVLVAAMGLVSINSAGAASPTFVQANETEVASGTTQSTAFTTANTAGNLIAVYVVWDNTGSVSLSDTRSNTYTAATGRVTWGSNWSAQVFYAKNIAAGANTVKATYANKLNSFGLLYIHEYSGLDQTSPLDVASSATGSPAAMNSGSATTTNASDLLFGAGSSLNTVTAAGSGFTTRSTASGNLTEDRNVSSTGSYAATATQNSSAWVMQMVAFKAATGGGDTTPPTVSITSPTAGATVSGSVNVTANAADNVAVANVQFFVDGNALGSPDTTSPYSVPWDTTAVTNGTHTLTARATDTSGNVGTSAAVNVTVSNAVAPGGPVAEYGFNEGTGTTTADASGNGLTGTLTNGATWGTGKYGSDVSLDGVNDYVDLGNPTQLQLTGSTTISGWINAAQFPADDAAIVSKRLQNGPGYQLDTTIDTGARTVGFKLTNSSGGDMIRYGATVLQTNTWYYVAGVYDATNQTMHVYLNGVLDDGTLVGPVTSTQQTSTANVNIGQRSGAFNFNGGIDEVRIYNQAISAAQVQSDMNTPIGGGNASDWTTYFNNNSRSGFGLGNGAITPATAPSLHLAWKANDSGNPESGVFSQPVVSNGTVYWGSFDGYERASDSTGRLLWKTNLGHTVSPTCTDPSSAGISSTATIRTDVPVGGATSVLYVGGGDTNMYALNAATGKVLWSTSLGAPPDNFIWSSPAVYGNSVYIGLASFGTCPDVQGQLFQLDRVTGAVQHTFKTVPDGCIGGGVWSSPTIDAAAGTVYITTGNQDPCSNGTEYAPAIVELHLSDLSFIGQWTVPIAEQVDPTDSDYAATPTLFNGVIGGQARLMVGAINKNGVFYAFIRDALNSGPVWRAQVAAGGSNPTVGTGDVATASWDGTTLYVGGDTTTIGSQNCSGTVNAINPSTGAFKWRSCITDTGFILGGVTAGDGGIVAAGENRNINVYNAATGQVVFTYPALGTFFGSPSIAEGNIYEGDMSGNLYVLTPSGGGGTTTTTTSTTTPTTTTTTTTPTTTTTTTTPPPTTTTTSTSTSTTTTSTSTTTTSTSTSTTTTSTSTSTTTTPTTSTSTTTTTTPPTSTTTTTIPNTGTPAFVQVNSATPQTSVSSVAVPYTAAQSAQDLNVVAIGINDVSTTITSVTDSAGNTYQVAAPLTRATATSQAIYYAKNIKAAAAGTNTVTVHFSAAAPFPDVRIAEYSGMDPNNPLDTSASAAGFGTSPNSGNFTTTSARDLIFGAGITTGTFEASGTGFTTRIITPIDGDIACDKNVTSTGTYNATARTNVAEWIMQGVAFRAK
jgi:outer membrane protein assembly factor BamB